MEKQFVIRARVDENLIKKLDFISEQTKQGRSEIIRQGIETLYHELGGQGDEQE